MAARREEGAGRPLADASNAAGVARADAGDERRKRKKKKKIKSVAAGEMDADLRHGRSNNARKPAGGDGSHRDRGGAADCAHEGRSENIVVTFLNERESGDAETEGGAIGGVLAMAAGGRSHAKGRLQPSPPRRRLRVVRTFEVQRVGGGGGTSDAAGDGCAEDPGQSEGCGQAGLGGPPVGSQGEISSIPTSNAFVALDRLDEDAAAKASSDEGAVAILARNGATAENDGAEAGGATKKRSRNRRPRTRARTRWRLKMQNMAEALLVSVTLSVGDDDHVTCAVEGKEAGEAPARAGQPHNPQPQSAPQSDSGRRKLIEYSEYECALASARVERERAEDMEGQMSEEVQRLMAEKQKISSYARQLEREKQQLEERLAFMEIHFNGAADDDDGGT